jgi:hypothetical protein
MKKISPLKTTLALLSAVLLPILAPAQDAGGTQKPQLPEDQWFARDTNPGFVMPHAGGRTPRQDHPEDIREIRQNPHEIHTCQGSMARLSSLQIVSHSL